MIAARRHKVAAVLVAAALATGLLSACQTHVGAAAYVGSTRISESTVGKYLSRNAGIQIDQSTGQPDNPKSDVLGSLIINDLFDRVFSSIPAGPPSAAALDASRTAVLQQAGIPNLGALQTEVTTSGYTTAYAGIALDVQAKLQILGADLKDDSNHSILLKMITNLHVKVSVSPRYGDWDTSTLSVNAGPFLPSFLQLAANDAPSSTGDGTAG